MEALRTGPGDDKVQGGAVALCACVDVYVCTSLCVAVQLSTCVRLGYPGRLHVYK